MRLPLSRLRTWTLDYPTDDIRGWVLRNLDGKPLGRVAELIVDTDSQHVTGVVLSTGKQYAAHDIWLGRHVLLLGDPVRGPFSATESPSWMQGQRLPSRARARWSATSSPKSPSSGARPVQSEVPRCARTVPKDRGSRITTGVNRSLERRESPGRERRVRTG